MIYTFHYFKLLERVKNYCYYKMLQIFPLSLNRLFKYVARVAFGQKTIFGLALCWATATRARKMLV